MKRAKFDDASREALTDCVRKIETTTDAELVLIVRARSGSYRHADYLFGALLAFVALLFLLFSPFDFHQYWVAIDVALLFILGAFVSSRSNSLRRLLTRKKFRSEAVRTAAAAMFYEAGIANTSAEMATVPVPQRPAGIRAEIWALRSGWVTYQPWMRTPSEVVSGTPR